MLGTESTSIKGLKIMSKKKKPTAKFKTLFYLMNFKYINTNVYIVKMIVHKPKKN